MAKCNQTNLSEKLTCEINMAKLKKMTYHIFIAHMTGLLKEDVFHFGGLLTSNIELTPTLYIKI